MKVAPTPAIARYWAMCEWFDQTCGDLLDYLDENQLRDLKAAVSGQFVGVGIELTRQKGALKVIAPLDGSPAQKAGIKAGDLIIKVDGKLVQHMTLREAINHIKGKSFKNYVNDLRIEHAHKDLLENPQKRKYTIEAIAYDNGKFWNNRVTYRIYHFGAIFNYSTMLCFTPHHKTCYIL